MNQRFNISLIETILELHGLSADKYKVGDFLDLQITKMPDFMKLGIILIGHILNVLTIFIKLKVFSRLELQDRACVVVLFKPLPLFKLFFRFYESIVILKALELRC